MKKPLYLHLGYSKTGTTYLQEQIFPLIDSVSLRHKPLAPDLFYDTYQRSANAGALGLAFKRTPDVWASRGDEIIRAIVGGRVDFTSQRAVLVSDEGASVWFDPHSLDSHLIGLEDAAQRAGFSEIRVLLVIRRQDQRLGSHYAQVSDRHRGANQERFEAYVDRLINTRAPFPKGAVAMDYCSIWNAVTSVVPRNRVLLLPYEMISLHSAMFFESLLSFLEASIADRMRVELLEGLGRTNARRVGRDTWALRPPRPFRIQLRPSRLFTSLRLPSALFLNIPDLDRGESIKITKQLSKKILERYESENRALSSDIQLDLSTYGYF